jgi:hypothetical protein
MQVDSVKIETNLSPEEKKHYMDEGQCFKCSKKGHQARNCQKGTREVKAQITEVTDGQSSLTEAPPYEEEPQNHKKMAINAIRVMDQAERTAMLEEMLKEDQDF